MQALPQEVNKDRYFTGILRLDDFIASTFNKKLLLLLAKEAMELSQITGLPDPIRVGVVSCTHFVRPYKRVPNRKELAFLFSRSAAVMCPPNTAGVDLIIPILMPNARNELIINEENVTFILVSVKNHKNRAKVRDYHKCATEFNSSYRCKLDNMPQHIYLSLYMGFGNNSGGGAVEVLEFVKNRNLKIRKDELVDEAIKQFVVQPTHPGPTDYQQQRSLALKSLLDMPSSSRKEVCEKVRLFRQVSGSVLGLNATEYECISGQKYQEVKLDEKLVFEDTRIDGMEVDSECDDVDDMHIATDEEPAPDGMLGFLKLILRAPETPLDMVSEPNKRLLQRMVIPADLDKVSEIVDMQIKEQREQEEMQM